MVTPNYTKKMSELRVRVSQHAKLEGDNNGNIRVLMPKINTQSILFYIAPLIILIIIFFITKPHFVCIEHIDKDNVITHKLNYKKVLISGLISGTVISVGLFAYFHNKSNSINILK